MKIFLVALLLMVSSAHATEIMLVLSDQEKQALIQMLDAATKAQGLQVAPAAVFLLNKINNAPVVTGKTEDPPKVEEPKK